MKSSCWFSFADHLLLVAGLGLRVWLSLVSFLGGSLAESGSLGLLREGRTRRGLKWAGEAKESLEARGLKSLEMDLVCDSTWSARVENVLVPLSLLCREVLAQFQ